MTESASAKPAAEMSAQSFPAVRQAVQDGIDRRLHTGVQIYVSQDLRPLLNTVIGSSGDSTPLTFETRMLWRSAGKPLTAMLVMQLVEQGVLNLESKLADVLPESAGTDKSEITIQHLLTHVAGFPATDTGWPSANWQESVHISLNEAATLPAGTAAYHPQTSWFVLGEIARRGFCVESNFTDVLGRQILSPIGMQRTSCGGFPYGWDGAELSDVVMLERNQGMLVPSAYSHVPYTTQPSPGGNLRGPVSELGRFYEVFLRDGLSADGRALLRPETMAAMTSRRRESMFDATFRHVVDFGLGFIIDSKCYGPETLPYGFGTYCSPKTFGHGGAQCAMGFCDPVNRIVVAWSANAFCGEGPHQRRNRALNDTIYLDLGFA